MLELQLTGGVAKTHDGLVKQAREGVAEGDLGAVQFWRKNFEKLYQAIPISHKDKSPSLEEYRKTHEEITDAYVKQMGEFNLDYWEHIQRLQTSWQKTNMDDALAWGEKSSNPGFDLLDPARAVGIKPRPRTVEEQQIVANLSAIEAAKQNLSILETRVPVSGE